MENQAQRAGKLTCCQKRKILQRNAYDFVDYVHDARIAAYLPDAGKRHQRREGCNDQVCSLHVKPLQGGKSYGRMASENRPIPGPLSTITIGGELWPPHPSLLPHNPRPTRLVTSRPRAAVSWAAGPLVGHSPCSSRVAEFP